MMAQKRKVAWILAIGNELLNGAIHDRNTGTICRFLEERGWEVSRGMVLPDVDAAIQDGLRQGIAEAELVFTTGGLGPTSDDLTRYSIATAIDSPLQESASARTKLEALFAERKRPMSENNLRQVLFPENAEVLTNTEGTADGFVSFAENAGRRVPIISLPGIPRELAHLLREQVAPWLAVHFPGTKPVERRFLRCFGRSESYLGERIEALKLPPEIEIAYRPMFPEILLTFTEATPGSGATLFEEILPKVREAIAPEFVFSDDPAGSMAQTVFRILRERSLTLSFAESCSGGMLADALVSLPGVSSVFLGSVVGYHNRTKENLLGVHPKSLLRHGAVSREVASEMAHGVRARTQADIGVSITGVAGPDGGTAEKPVGTVFFGISTAEGEESVHQFYNVERNMFRSFCTTAALDLIRRKLLGFPLEWQRR